MRAGEIFGIAGVAGNGQNELLLALSGEDAGRRPAAITLDGKPVGELGTSDRRRKRARARAGGAQRPCRGAGLHAEPTTRC